MPAEVISTIHQQAAPCEKMGIVVTKKDNNIINEINEPDIDI